MSVQLINKVSETDNLTGEILEDKTTIHSLNKLPEEPNYVKIYVQAWCSCNRVKAVNKNFLIECFNFMTYADSGQVIYFNREMKSKIAKNLGWSEKSGVDRCNHEIKKLDNAGVFRKVGYGTYQVNPELVGKGPWKDIYNLKATMHIKGVNAGKIELEAEYKKRQ